jgi:hypothetical protein
MSGTVHAVLKVLNFLSFDITLKNSKKTQFDVKIRFFLSLIVFEL